MIDPFIKNLPSSKFCGIAIIIASGAPSESIIILVTTWCMHTCNITTDQLIDGLVVNISVAATHGIQNRIMQMSYQLQ